MLVRADIDRGLQSAQLVHAAGESVSEPVPPGTYAVVLSVPDEAALRSHCEQLRAAGVEHRLIIENSEPYAGQAMAIGVKPAKRSKLRRYFSNLPLLR